VNPSEPPMRDTTDSANDFVIIAGYQSSGQTFTTRTVDVVRPYLSVLEVPSW
jgi:hypothetical protein